MYDNLDPRSGERVWTDLCRGPHLPRTNHIPAFSLTRSAAAYWRGSEKNPQLQRIYGTAWESKDAHKAHLERLAEAERRDHRRLGAELDLFSFPDEIGSGLAVFHPKGGVIKREMEDYVRAATSRRGFDYVGSPHITKEGLFQTSGHLPYYADTMFPPMEMEKRVLPQGHELPDAQPDLPVARAVLPRAAAALFEFGSVYRYEKSGVVHGLTRVRGLTQDDSHSYVTPSRRPARSSTCWTFVLGLLRDFGLDDYYLELSTRTGQGQVHRLRRGVGGGHRGPGAGRPGVRARLVLDPAVRRSTAPRSRCRPATPSAAPGRCRPSSTTSTSRAVRPGVPGRRRHPAAAGDDPLGQVRLDRAVLRGARRALRRGVPPGCRPCRWSASRSPRSTTTTCARCSKLRPRHPGRDRRHDDRLQKKIRNASKAKVPFVLIAGGGDRSRLVRCPSATAKTKGRDRRDHRRDRGTTAGLTVTSD